VTSTSTSSSASAPKTSQSEEQQIQQLREMHQEDIEVDIPNSTVDRRNCEVQQRLRDAQEFVGTPRTGSKQQRQLEKYTGYMALLNQLVDCEPSSY